MSRLPKRQKIDVGEDVMSYRKKFLGEPTPRTEPNHRSVMIKQIETASTQGKHEGRFVLNNSQIYTIVVCGRITQVDQAENYTDFAVSDGTGTIRGRIWSWSNTSETIFTNESVGAYYTIVSNVIMHENTPFLQAILARKVLDHNLITTHFLQAIHDDCMLNCLDRNELEKWDKAKYSADTHMRSALGMELDKEAVISLLSADHIRESSAGATFKYIIHELHMAVEAGRETLKSMLDEGSIYNTIDYNHFKLADEN